MPTLIGTQGLKLRRVPVVVAAGRAFATWSTTDKDAAIALSGSDLIATRNLAYDGAFHGVRANASHSTGKYFFSVLVGTTNTNLIGIATGLAGLDSTFNPVTSVECVVVNPSGQVFWNGSGNGTGNTWTTGDVVDVAIDRTAELFWYRVNGGDWNADPLADPANGISGFDISTSATGPYYPAAWFLIDTAAFTANFGATTYTYAAPSGFGNW